MNTGKYFLKFIIISAAIVLAAACKKDDTTDTTLPSLSGSLRFDASPYILKGETLTMTPRGIYHPEDKGVGLYWQVSPLMDSRDTTRYETDDPATVDGTFEYTFPDDTLGTFTVTCTAFADGYYTSSSSRYVTIVDPEETLIDNFIGYDEDSYGKETDPRDSRIYNTVTLSNGQTWMAENLSYAGTDTEPLGIAFENAEAMSEVFGRYYTWEEAKKACPTGWNLPSEADWLELAKALADEGVTMTEYQNFEGIAGKMMVEAKFNVETAEMWDYQSAVKITNESGMAVIPCGFANISGSVGSFESAYSFAAFWTATVNASNTDQAYIRYINCYAPDLFITSSPIASFGASVRCIKSSN